jgi:DNA-binding response OmpR family regulator
MKRVLIADDEPHVIRVLKQVLMRAGYHVDSVNNGNEALNYLLENPLDILITDIQMPKMSGDQLCRVIDANMPDREFAIIVMTSRTEREHRAWASKIGNLTFLEKPISIRQLLSELEVCSSRVG